MQTLSVCTATQNSGVVLHPCIDWAFYADISRDCYLRGRVFAAGYICLDGPNCDGWGTAWSQNSYGWDNSHWGQKIGDRRVSFTKTTASQASVLAKQGSGGALDSWSLEGNSATKIFTVVAGKTHYSKP